MVFNHMTEVHGNNYQLFANGLIKLRPILEELSNKTRIVWMQQAPIVYLGETWVTNDEAGQQATFLAKLDHYNAGIRSIIE